MSIENPKFEKEARIKDVEKQIDEAGDALGHPIDLGIKEAVVAFNLLDFPTRQSCEGHVEGIPVPWISIKAENEPEEQFVGEKEIYKKIAGKYDISVKDVEEDVNHDASLEAAKEASKNDYTKEYEDWCEKNKVLMEKASKLLNEFYEDREIKPNIKLQIDGGAPGFRIHNSGVDYKSFILKKRKEPSEKEKVILESNLIKYREEMNDLAKFLKEKFLSH